DRPRGARRWTGWCRRRAAACPRGRCDPRGADRQRSPLSAAPKARPGSLSGWRCTYPISFREKTLQELTGISEKYLETGENLTATETHPRLSGRTFAALAALALCVELWMLFSDVHFLWHPEDVALSRHVVAHVDSVVRRVLVRTPLQLSWRRVST